MTNTENAAPSWLWSCVARGFGLALVLTGLRAAVLFAMERIAHGDELNHVVDRVATALPFTLVEAGVAALVLSFLAIGAQRMQAGAGRALLRGIVALAAAAVILLLLGGWTGDDYSRRIGLDTARGRQVAAALAVLSLALGAAVTLLRPRPATWRAPAVLAATAALIGLIIPALTGGHGAHMVFLEPVDNLLAEPGRWSAATGEARVDLLTPSRDYRRDGADMPSLVLSPAVC